MFLKANVVMMKTLKQFVNSIVNINLSMKIRLDGLKMIYKEYALNNFREKIIGWILQGKKRKIGAQKEKLIEF